MRRRYYSSITETGVKYGYLYNWASTQNNSKYGYLYNWYATQDAVKYGYLYNWYVTQGTGNNSLIPLAMEALGWSIPTDTDINTLTSYLISNGFNYDGTTSTDKTAKSIADSLDYWNTSSNIGAVGNSDYPNKRNITGLSIRGAGYRDNYNGSFQGLKNTTYFWTKSTYIPNFPYFYAIEYLNTNINLVWGSSAHRSLGCSIRLVRPATTQEQLQVNGTSCGFYIGNDNTKYQTTKIGTQVWITSNLAETKFIDGSLINNITDNNTWFNSTTSALCSYNNIKSNVLYLPIISSAMEDDGWIIPTLEFNTLKSYIGGDSVSGGKLKETGTYHWINNVGSTNDYNFNARGSGYRQYNDGAYVGFKYVFNAWTKYLDSGFPSQGLVYSIVNNQISSGYNWMPYKNGCSIRLVRPATTQEQTQVDGSLCSPYIGNDGLYYDTVKIGTQVWMAYNLAETKYRDGSTIQKVSDNSAWNTLTSAARCVVDDTETNATNNYLIPDSMSSIGWTLPTFNSSNVYDILTLTTYLGGYSTCGAKLKSTGTRFFDTPNTGATNEVKFDGRGGGIRNQNGSFNAILRNGFFWTKYEWSSTEGLGYSLAYDAINVNFDRQDKRRGCSIRLVRPATSPELLQADGSSCAPYIGNDNTSYPTIKIGTQVWMAVNLAETKKDNGTILPNITDETLWTSSTVKSLCSYSNNINNVFF